MAGNFAAIGRSVGNGNSLVSSASAAAVPRTSSSLTIRPTHEGDLVITRDGPFRLQAGGELTCVTVRYAIYGELNQDSSNATLVCHALSGSARVGDWWAEMFGPAGLWDLRRDCVIGMNVLGSCYGSTGPAAINPENGKPYGEAFPMVSVRDMVRAQSLAVEQLGISRLQAVIGGSLGGMQALQWAVDYPDRVGAGISIAANPISAMGLALNHLQRQAIELGKLGNSAASEQAGLALARAIAMCSYKSAKLFDQRSGRAANNGSCVQENPFRSLRERFDIAGYLDYQGSKFTRRFDANSYIVLSKAMDTFDPVREYGSDAAAFGRISCPITTVGISSDWLFPSSGVRSWAQRLHSAGATCEYVELNSDHGHDAFLAEAPRMAALLRPYAEKWRQTNPRHNQEQAR